MATVAITNVREARITANEWLMSHLPDRFAAGIPRYEHILRSWRIPVWLSYPGIEALGPVGELVVDETGTVSSHTSVDEMKERALKLVQQNRDQIEAPLL